MGSKSQATKTIKALRIQMVIQMLQSGKYHYEIVNELSKLWECSDRNVARYITAAFKLIHDNYDTNAIENLLSKYDMLYQRALKMKDVKAATKILDSVAKLKGLYTKKVEVSGAIKIETIKLKEIIKPKNE